MKIYTLVTSLVLMVVLTLLTFGHFTTVNAQGPTTDNMTLTSFMGGDTRQVTVQDNLAYLNQGPQLAIIDITDPANPIQVGQTDILSQLIRDIDVAGDYAYLTDKDGLKVVDVSDPTAPEIVYTYLSETQSFNVAIEGDYLYLSRSNNLDILDISTPTNITSLGSYAETGILQVEVVNNYAALYIYNFYTQVSGVHILDLTQPATPTKVAEVITNELHDLVLTADYLYILNQNLTIFSMADPTTPQEVGRYTVPSGISGYGLAVQGFYAYIVRGTGEGFHVVDISNPALPTGVDYFTASQRIYDLALTENYALLAAGSLQIVDIPTASSATNDNDLTVVGSYQINHFDNLAVADNIAYLGEGNLLHLVDTINASQPIHLTSYPLNGDISTIVVANNLAYITVDTARRDGTFIILDVTNPAAITHVSSIENLSANDSVLVGTNLFMAWDDGLHVLDVSNPISPAELGFFATSPEATSVVVVDNYAYLAIEDRKFESVDISDLTNMQSARAYGTWWYTSKMKSIEVNGISYLLGGTYGANVFIKDISDGTNPHIMANHLVVAEETDIGIADMATEENYLYLALGGSNGIQVVDMTIPTTPTIAGYLDLPAIVPQYVEVINQQIYVVDWAGTFFVAQFTPIGTKQTTDQVAKQPDGEHNTTQTIIKPVINESPAVASITQRTSKPNVNTLALHLSPGYTQTVQAGTQVTYTHVLANASNQAQTIIITAADTQGWLTDLHGGGVTGSGSLGTGTFGQILTITLAAGSQTNLYLNLNIPNTVVHGAIDDITLTATSQTMPTVTTTVKDVAVVERKYILYLPVVMKGFVYTPLEVTLGVTARFGSDFAYTLSYEGVIDNALPLAKELGVNVDRYWLQWYKVEYAPGQYDWTVPDEIINGLKANDIDVLLTIFAPPAWISGTGQEGCGLMEDVAGVERFVDALLDRYGDDIAVLEFMNETDGNTPYTEWGPYIGCLGKQTELYTTQLHRFYDEVKTHRPEILVAYGGLTYDNWEHVNRDFFEETLNYGAADFFDVLSIHYYPINPAEFPTLAHKIEALKSIMEARNISDKPIWVTETAISATAPESLDIQSNYITQNFARGYCAGAEAIFWFNFFQPPWSKNLDQARWLIDTNFEKVNGFASYQTLATKIGGLWCEEIYTNVPTDVEAYHYANFERSVYVIWSNNGTQTVTVPTTTGGGTLFSRDGAVLQSLTATNNEVQFEVGTTPVLLEIVR